MKKVKIITLIIIVLSLTGCAKTENKPVEDNIISETSVSNDNVIKDTSEKTQQIDSSIKITSLPARSVCDPSKYMINYTKNNLEVQEDLSRNKKLAYSLIFSDKTSFLNTPPEFKPDELIEWGKDQGLGISILKEHGFTGNGSVVAYVDQRILDHEQFEDINIHYQNNVGISGGDMHGMAALSLLAGKDIGIVPEAEVYYYAHPAWELNQETHAECLYQIMEQNLKLPEEKQIRMVGFSDFINEEELNSEALIEATKACEESGIMAWYSNDYGCGYFSPESDKNNPDNYIAYKDPSQENKIHVPTATLTTATTLSGAEYIYWGQNNGTSWAMPYVLGLYADALTIDPELTKEDLQTILKNTAKININNVNVISPIDFIATILERVDRDEEAESLRQDYNNSLKFFYAVMNKSSMTNEDLLAAEEYLRSIKGVTVLEFDVTSDNSVYDIYNALKKDHEERGGIVTGIQLFGTPSDVSTFDISDKIIYHDDIMEDESFKSDLFFGNLNNKTEDLYDYSLYDHFNEGKNISLIPEWPVVRLPLKKGQYKAFFDKYEDFAMDTKYSILPLVNFNVPVFSQEEHVDNASLFLERLKNEYKIIDDFKTYGTLEGQYPIKEPKVLGDFNAENLSKENNSIVEYFIYAYGRKNAISRLWHEDNEQKLEPVITPDNINDILSLNPYYLDCWACYSGADMDNNIVTSALNGKCVGIFAMTNLAPKNNLNCYVPYEEIKNGNFYYFYYIYLKSLHNNRSRAASFFDAQNAYAQSTLQNININDNYQFNLLSLFMCENFGVMEPDTVIHDLIKP